MDVVLMILYATLILGFLVFIHEGGHYLAARAFGVRVSEFMLGLPGPHVGFTKGDTTFGITAVPLGGYARICGMEAGEESPHLKNIMRELFARGTANMEDIALALNISDDEAYEALEELVEWGTILGPTRKDAYNTYRTPAFEGTWEYGIAPVSAVEGTAALALQEQSYAEGEPRPVADVEAFYAAERKQTYRSLPFWKRCIILLAGPGVNVLFTILVFVLVYSIIGYDVQNTETGEISHIVVDPLRSISAGFNYVGMVFMAIVGLFNPQTAAETVSNSTSLVGIAVLSKTAVEEGILSAIMFSAMLSVSLGLMNMLPIPPLDGGRFVVEIYQKIRRRSISPRALGSLSMAGVALFTLFFIFMVNQDIQRFVFGNWGG